MTTRSSSGRPSSMHKLLLTLTSVGPQLVKSVAALPVAQTLAESVVVVAGHERTAKPGTSGESHTTRQSHLVMPRPWLTYSL